MREIELVEKNEKDIIRYKDNKEVIHILDSDKTNLERRKEEAKKLNEEFYKSHNKRQLLEKNNRKRLYGKIAVCGGLILVLSTGVGIRLHRDYVVRRAVILNENKTFTSYEIQKGDTITSIATKYYNQLPEDKKQYISLNQYKNEIIATNNLIMPDLITAGNHLIIPYYLEDEISLKNNYK